MSTHIEIGPKDFAPATADREVQAEFERLQAAEPGRYQLWLKDRQQFAGLSSSSGPWGDFNALNDAELMAKAVELDTTRDKNQKSAGAPGQAPTS